MTADWTRLPVRTLERISTRITNEVEEVNRVVSTSRASRRAPSSGNRQHLDDVGGWVFTRGIEHTSNTGEIGWCRRCCCDGSAQGREALGPTVLNRHTPAAQDRRGIGKASRGHSGPPRVEDLLPDSQSLLPMPESLADRTPAALPRGSVVVAWVLGR